MTALPRLKYGQVGTVLHTLKRFRMCANERRQKKASPCKDKVGKGSERLNERVCSKINNGSQAGRYSTCMV